MRVGRTLVRVRMNVAAYDMWLARNPMLLMMVAGILVCVPGVWSVRRQCVVVVPVRRDSCAMATVRMYGLSVVVVMAMMTMMAVAVMEPERPRGQGLGFHRDHKNRQHKY